jgi:hypothetical protein
MFFMNAKIVAYLRTFLCSAECYFKTSLHTSLKTCLHVSPISHLSLKINFFKILQFKDKLETEIPPVIKPETVDKCYNQGDQNIGKKICPNCGKSGQYSCQAKNAKIPMSKLSLKVQNIYIKPLVNP